MFCILRLLIVTIVFAQFELLPAIAQNQTETYSETRKLLLNLERSSSSKALKKLFEEGDIRLPDLIRALEDAEKRVNLNSQVVLKYLAEPQGLTAMETWYQHRRKQGKDYWMPKMELLSEAVYLKGDDADLEKLLLKNASSLEASKWGARDLSAQLIAYNKKLKAALIEVVEGKVFTTGWHVVIKQEMGRWRLVSDNLIWQH